MLRYLLYMSVMTAVASADTLPGDIRVPPGAPNQASGVVHQAPPRPVRAELLDQLDRLRTMQESAGYSPEQERQRREAEIDELIRRLDDILAAIDPVDSAADGILRLDPVGEATRAIGNAPRGEPTPSGVESRMDPAEPARFEILSQRVDQLERRVSRLEDGPWTVTHKTSRAQPR